MFDRLPLEPATGLNEVEDGQRVVRAALSIRDSDVRGVLRHRSSENVLRFEGPVDFQGSRFREGVDLSRSVFQQKADLSGAIFEKEAHFVRGHFVGELPAGKRNSDPAPDFISRCFRAAGLYGRTL